ncbi:MAG: amino acid adenylation domain-containing protein [Pseudohongiellaceae bacterium]|jgi:amino acid adenylation domain-containing protein
MQLQDVEDFYPLSPLQQGLLFHSLSEPDSGMYFNQSLMTLHGAFDTEAFAEAWRRTIAQHPILRTFFVWEGVERPVQVVRKSAEMPYAVHDWRDVSAEHLPGRLEELRQADLREGFDLSQAPLMRVELLRTADEQHEFSWSFHHILMDGWSMFRVLGDVFGVYDALCSGGEYRFEPCQPYRNHIAWLQQQSLPAAETFWRKTLSGFTAPTPLLVDPLAAEAAPAADEFAHLVLNTSAETAAGLSALASKHHVTLNTILQGAWSLALSRYSNEEDVLLGAVVSGRSPNLKGVESMVGLFINSLPVRVSTPGDEQLLPWLSRIQAEQAELREYEYSPLVEIQGWSDVPRGTQLFDSIFLFENYKKDVPLEELCQSVRIGEVHWFERLNYPLTAIAIPGDAVTLRLIYQTERYTEATIQRMLEQWATLLDGMVANPQATLAQLPFLTATEEQTVLQQFNDTAGDYPTGQCLHELFEAQVARTPDAPAVSCGNETISYSELNARANQLAQHLLSLGARPDMLIGVCQHRRIDMLVSIFAILKSGAAYLPLDPKYPQERLAFMVSDGGAKVVITHSELADHLRDSGCAAQLLCLDQERETLAALSSHKPEAPRADDALAYVIYTSGSTGVPKGTAIEHRSLVTLVHWSRENYSDAELAGVLGSTSICFDLSTWEIFVTLSWGGRLVLVENALELATAPARDKVTLVNTVPSAIAELIRMDGVPPSVKTVNLAGEALRADLVDKVYGLGVTRVCDLYGPSEDTTYSTYAQREVGGPEIIGKPVGNTRAYLLDARMRPVPLGVAGEIHLAGAGLARGYLNRPDVTAERFIPDPFSDEPGARLYRTGDLARYRPDGNMELVGRIDHQVKVRGFRIELGEIEIALGKHPAVKDTVVMAREDTPGEKRLVAYVVYKAQPGPTAAELRKTLRESMPEYMVPTAIVALDELPRTPNGKTDRKALPVPEADRSQLETSYAAPDSDIERQIAEIWQKILQVEKVGVRDNFFDLGGHSLHLIRVHGELRTGLGLEIPMVDMFQFPTVAALAKHFADGGSSAEPEPVVDTTEKLAAGRSRMAQMQARRRRGKPG